ncbi:MAG: M3 family metallopeptidase [Candidatus Acidiferrales bacterium]
MQARTSALRTVARVTTTAAILAALSFASAPSANAQSQPGTPYGPHLWDVPLTPDTLQKRLEEQLALAQKSIDQMLAVSGPRTIENTLAPFDDITIHLDAAGMQASVMQSVGTDAAIRDRAQKMIGKVSAVSTALSLNQAVYKALAAVDTSHADASTKYYVERTLLEFRIAGVDKDEATRARIQKLSDELTELSTKFERNVQDSQLKVVVKNAAELDGLPSDYIKAHPPAADGAITLTSDSPDVIPVLKFAKSADLRRRMYIAYDNRAYPQNMSVLADILKKREELANILGYKHWSDLNAADKMALTSNNIASFIDEIDAASRPIADREYQMVLATARKTDPSISQVSAADRDFYYEQLRRTQFDFNSEEARPYFPYDRVQQGILDVASKLFSIRFEPVKNAVVWDPSVSTFDLYDAVSGKQLGRIYLDMHPRPGKNQWFSSNPLLDGKKGVQLPEAMLICNFPGGKPGDPGLMEYSDVTTFFHEFGHLMHWIFQGQREWAGFGSNLEYDFVEAPSQMLEEWMHDPKVLATFAKNPQTGEPIPAELVARANRADAFGRGLWARGQLVYTNVSFEIHNEAPNPAKLETVMFENRRRFLPFAVVEGDHQIASFDHLLGYSSGYYTYLWDKVIAEDFFGQFNRDNLLAPEVALRYRTTILAQTGGMSANDLVTHFLGRKQSTDAFVHWMNQEFVTTPTSAGK